MASTRTPFLLRVWMLGTWACAYPIALLSRYLHRRMGADPLRFSERLGWHGAENAETVIWFHAASLGEVIQIKPLAKRLARTEQTGILVTTTTASGADWVAREMPNAHHRFVPIDTPSAVRRFLNGWSISAAIFVEGDLWPRLIRDTARAEIPQILLNARHSRTRARLPAVFSALLTPFALVTCRSHAVAEGMRSLGLPPDRIHVLPDLRLTLPRLTAADELTTPLSKAIGTRPHWLAASTHPADEDAVLTAHLKVIESHPETLLIVAPRHPRRGAPLQQLARDMGLGTARRSLGEEIAEGTQVYIADTLGELGAFYALSRIAFLGGSLGTEGGHNPYEPASFESAIVHGPHVKNFVDAYAALDAAGAALQVAAPNNLGSTLVRLLETDQSDEMARASRAFMDDTQNCLEAYATLVTDVIRKASAPNGTTVL